MVAIGYTRQNRIKIGRSKRNEQELTRNRRIPRLFSMGKRTARPAAKAFPGRKGGATTRAGGAASAAANATKRTSATAKKDSTAAAAAKMMATEEAAAAAKAAAEKATPAPAAETAAPAGGDAASEAAVMTTARKAKAAAEVKTANAAKAQQGNKRRLAAMLDELDESDTDEIVDMGVVPGPPQVHVLEGDDIPTPGDPTEVLIGGRRRKVIWGGDTNADASLMPFVVWGGCDGGMEDPLIAITNAALESKLREEGLTVIDKRLLEAGGRLHADEMDGCAKAWKLLQTAAVNHGMMTQEEEEMILRCMLNQHSQPGSLRHLLNVLTCFIGSFGAIKSLRDLTAMVDTMDMAAMATKKREENASPQSRRDGGGGARRVRGVGDHLEEALFTAGDGSLLGTAINDDGTFSKLIEGPLHLKALHKGSQAKHSIGLSAVIDTVTLLVKDQSAEVTKAMVAAVIKAELTEDNVQAKMGGVTTETGTHGFDAIAEVITIIGETAGLPNDVKGLVGITRALRKQLAGAAGDKIRAAADDITALARRQLGLHFQGVARGRMQGKQYTASADDLSESVLKKVRELKVMLTFYAGSLKYTAATAPPQRPTPALLASAVQTLPAAPLPAVGVRGGGGTMSPADAVAILRATLWGKEATAPCPFITTTSGCGKAVCRFKN